MRIKSTLLAVIVIGIFFGGIGISSLLGYWKTTGSRVPTAYITGGSAQQYNPSDIKGSYTFGDIAKYFDIPEDDLANAFGLKSSEPPDSFKCKDLPAKYSALSESGKEIGVGSVRYFVSLYKGVPYTGEPAFIPQSAADVLKSKNTLKENELATLNQYTIQNAK